MTVLYEDPHVVCDDDALTIKRYYFPVGSKRIPYSEIRRVDDTPMGWLTGKLRLWGMGPAPYWFHLDVERPGKERCIVIDRGGFVKIALTPADHEAVLTLLRERTR
ncbi:hypothetical protein [Polyangium mundeleinium]|uniref:Bacterial Pleckstrin homology domain-containing protein n=1 Tax=Polyangium mundeleinium TaxID=2995306 RepID=A0ABT5EX88_9BACT|nr:hypothetical protein [Polyangium mundeleinium]MDC0745912.1 hypothetical protein [Polyangium mundeleinium]